MAAGAIAKIFQSVVGNQTGRKIIGGAALYAGGSAIKAFSESYQQTPGFENLSTAGQTTFKSAAWLTGSAMQVKGAFGTAGHLAGKAALSATGTVNMFGRTISAAGALDKTSRTLNHIGNLKPLAWVGKTIGKGIGWGVTKAVPNMGRGAVQWAHLTGKAAVTGLRYGPGAGASSMMHGVATMRNPYLGAIGLGGVMAAPSAIRDYKKGDQTPRTHGAMRNYKKGDQTPRTQGTQAMNRGNYNRVSRRDRSLGV